MGKKIRKKSLLIVVMLLIVLIFLINGIIKIFNNIEQKQNKQVKGSFSEETEKPIESKSITISFAGDVTMGNYKGSPYDSTFDQEFKKQDGNYDYFFENDKLVSIDEPQIIPCSISSTKYKNDYKPTILDGSERGRVLNKIKEIRYRA